MQQLKAFVYVIIATW